MSENGGAPSPESESISTKVARVAQWGLGRARSAAKQVGDRTQQVGDRAQEVGERVVEAGNAVAEVAGERWQQRADVQAHLNELAVLEQQIAREHHVDQERAQEASDMAGRRVGISMNETMAGTEAAIARAQRRDAMQEARNAIAVRENSGNEADVDFVVMRDSAVTFRSVSTPAIDQASVDKGLDAAYEDLDAADGNGVNSGLPGEQWQSAVPYEAGAAEKRIPATTSSPDRLAARVETAEHNTANGATAEEVLLRTSALGFNLVGTPQRDNSNAPATPSQDSGTAVDAARGHEVNTGQAALKGADVVPAHMDPAAKGLDNASDGARRGWDPPAPRDTRGADASNPWVGATATVSMPGPSGEGSPQVSVSMDKEMGHG